MIPSPSVKIKIIGGKIYSKYVIGQNICLRCKGKILLGDVNKLCVFKSLLTMPSNVLPLHLKQIWCFKTTMRLPAYQVGYITLSVWFFFPSFCQTVIKYKQYTVTQHFSSKLVPTSYFLIQTRHIRIFTKTWPIKSWFLDYWQTVQQN